MVSDDVARYHAVYCAGGRGPEYIRTDKRIQAMVRHLHETEKPIFTICHGVQILVAVEGAVRGKKVGALGACEPEVTLAGGTYIDLSPTDAYVDGTMVSAKGWTALAAFPGMPEGVGHRGSSPVSLIVRSIRYSQCPLTTQRNSVPGSRHLQAWPAPSR